LITTNLFLVTHDDSIWHLLSKKKNLMMIGYGPRDDRGRLLEYAKALPPRTPLA
jgi:hypothetical protein